MMNVEEILLKHNIQWDNQSFDTGIPREMLSRVLAALKARHVVAITGARRSGKSYLFRQIIRELLNRDVKPGNLCQINFEDPWFIQYRENPDILTDIYRGYLQLHNPSGTVNLFLDEIQNIGNWQYWVRDLYDRERNVRIFITGSNSDLLSTDLATHLTGRVLSYEIFPFSFQEFLRGLEVELPEKIDSQGPGDAYKALYRQRDTIIHYLERSFSRGLFPEVAFLDDEELVKEILSQYFQNVIFRDIVPRFSIRNTNSIEELAHYLSTNFTTSYSYKRLADMSGADEKTVKEYLSYFEKAYLFFQVDYFDYSLKKRLRRNKKIYSLDCGVRRATSFSFSEDTGRYAENMVFLSLRRRFGTVYYWQDDRSRREVDFVVSEKKRVIAVNVSYTDDIPDREFDALKDFSRYTEADRCIVVSRDVFEKRTVNDLIIEIIPLWLFLFLRL